mmetsp:Transcript_4336/g.13115  ORF Transcript_4336/g.13115 Transcript_4336/m.13115 type:complete len:277 (-) Transcript_4336:82-912(-)
MGYPEVKYSSELAMTELRRRPVRLYSLLVCAALGIFAILYSMQGGYLSSLGGGGSATYATEPVPKFKGTVESTMVEWPWGMLHVDRYVQPKKKISVIAIHGGDAETQNSKHWTPNLRTFEKMGSFYMLDLPGFGETTSNIRGTGPLVPGYAIHRVVEEAYENGLQDNKLVFVARAWGAKVLMDMFKKYPEVADNTAGLVLIAPVIPQPAGAVESVPTLIVWGDKDPDTPVSLGERLAKSFKKSTLMVMDSLPSHAPESDRPKTFQKEVLQWMKTLN